ncbi:hypothetical protein [Paraburkholderia silvatlantica]|uniref:hypothetical protein n=1 Tax=Paraburkholderia silvatlantica TaxID=321895 RepID=UPI0010614C9F|nr:hypothetical protein [Paraburkholderia silvatlantica]TDR04343.1 hypothetical protein C7412_102249 [Paraburkholderia silvatlantica]
MIPTLPLAYLVAHLRDARVLELRARLPSGQWLSGLFDDPHAALREMQALGVLGANVYSTVNRPAAAVAYRVRNAMQAHALRDAEISHRVRLPFDFDPVRPVDAASTAQELAYALEARDRVAAALAAQGWPEPARGMSGNGGHLLYRCCVPVTPESGEQIAAIYAGLFEDFTGGEVVFDRSVKNPARIWRLYGTTNRKGTPTAERPHRVATIAIPREWCALDPRRLDALANVYARRNVRTAPPPRPMPAPTMPAQPDGSRGDLGTLDAVAWFAGHNAYLRPLGRGKHAVACPWSGEHSAQGGPLDSSTVMWEAQGGTWPTFHCSHSHCEGRGIRDVLALWGDADGFCAAAWQPEKRRGK